MEDRDLTGHQPGPVADPDPSPDLPDRLPGHLVAAGVVDGPGVHRDAVGQFDLGDRLADRLAFLIVPREERANLPGDDRGGRRVIRLAAPAAAATRAASAATT